jgi:hypothetical protein
MTSVVACLVGVDDGDGDKEGEADVEALGEVVVAEVVIAEVGVAGLQPASIKTRIKETRETQSKPILEYAERRLDFTENINILSFLCHRFQSVIR